ncbi:hypothetical protein PTSG_11504 [Salpingoeca rosetta]|uniref:Uncharacterized protein n=1 Tax=Salpingoeca rosetta (strain ATCC 50818 / BSB-021) TaxID=946362 RepID=F2UTP0_SALR5|nr:uncharacterized protein PTSG_11504 [Salpingoeca rosetta]EGD73748.1 hypothetical protein PTSG_11504 [Salpingoeca rosetta]|eukprot:XP_004987464.1 hypothetical protein PTSG_11504 [Salpingoeca rosetta]
MSSQDAAPAPQFKKKKRRGNLKKREKASMDDILKADEDVAEKIEAALEEQKLRSREQGISAEELAKRDEEIDEEEEQLIQYGLQTKKSKTSGGADDDAMKGIEKAFAEETGRLDRDKEMLQYIKEKLQESEGKKPTGKQTSKYEQMMASLYKVPERLQEEKQEEEVERGMLSSAVLQGIPEVSLGIDEKIKNIEETERAKASIHRSRSDKFTKVLGLRKVDSTLNYANARFDAMGARRRQEDAGELFDRAQQQAFDQGITESLAVKPEREQEAARRRQRRDDGLSSDDRAFNAYRRRFKRY